MHLWIGSNFEKEGNYQDLGIYQANALFWYADAELTIPTPYKDSYNGLKYKGVFQGD